MRYLWLGEGAYLKALSGEQQAHADANRQRKNAEGSRKQAEENLEEAVQNRLRNVLDYRYRFIARSQRTASAMRSSSPCRSARLNMVGERLAGWSGKCGLDPIGAMRY